MSDVKLVYDAYGRPKPVKTEELFEYGLGEDAQPLASIDSSGVSYGNILSADGNGSTVWLPQNSFLQQSSLVRSDIESILAGNPFEIASAHSGKFIAPHMLTITCNGSVSYSGGGAIEIWYYNNAVPIGQLFDTYALTSYISSSKTAIMPLAGLNYGGNDLFNCSIKMKVSGSLAVTSAYASLMVNIGISYYLMNP